MITGTEYFGYAKELARLCDWNYTTVVRTHYKMKEHIADNKVQSLVDKGIADNVFLTLENDRDYADRYTRTSTVNHMHLLLNIPNKIQSFRDYRTYLCEALGVNRKAVLDIEPIRSNKQLAEYVTKHLNKRGSHHNFFTNTNRF
tara:strand:- start:470 stop:901 length:432 start_codon:yes stop_codon:yes gene_type:complete